ncbi:hypothetical protein EYW49_04425 [Siculibacillus lacustris]|uniref:Flp family type IVb pilin n=1 Tax=Siculibacillus lacustris TaxID=1549641 RepID=A0A4Q9VX05_9HYPH|nr:hypothetical protein [Siculibacillus lacustris]TBW40431.1 hypothetical protein EYW49_04425 [Siculibacillus lacustris]
MKNSLSHMRRSLTFRFRSMTTDPTGSVSMEYGLVGTLISIAIVGALSSTGGGVADKWNNFSNTIISYLR